MYSRREDQERPVRLRKPESAELSTLTRQRRNDSPSTSVSISERITDAKIVTATVGFDILTLVYGDINGVTYSRTDI